VTAITIQKLLWHFADFFNSYFRRTLSICLKYMHISNPLSPPGKSLCLIEMSARIGEFAQDYILEEAMLCNIIMRKKNPIRDTRLID
jgi:hypothetical protein